LLGHYIKLDMHGCDPFARNAKWAIVTNDEDPKTTATFHLDALEFMRTRDDAEFAYCLYDPPYSAHQVAVTYRGYGRKVYASDTHRKTFERLLRDEVDRTLKPSGFVVSFGWNSCGMGVTRGFQMIDGMVVAHGGPRNDTLVVVERRRD
jgi:hypothetical protein